MDKVKIPEISIKEIEMDEKPFARGGFGEVYRARWQTKMVVVKVIRTEGKEHEAEVTGEASLNFGLKHENVIKLFCIARMKSEQLGIVMELAEHGSLDQSIGKIHRHKHRHTHTHTQTDRQTETDSSIFLHRNFYRFRTRFCSRSK